MRFSKAIGVGFLVLILNSAWLVAFPTASLFYVINVIAHIVLGAGLFAALWLSRSEILRIFRRESRLAVAALTLSAALGFWLYHAGATRPNTWIVITHAGFAFLGALLVWQFAAKRNTQLSKPLAVVLLLGIALPAGSWLRERWFPGPGERIVNPTTAPLSMDFEGAGKSSPFFPSSANSNTGGLIPSDFFMDSKVCGECHKDIYEQWAGSMHRFSSFNNQFYRKSIEYMQEVQGDTQGSKWCAGCHDHAMFFNGRFEKPAIGQIDTPQAHAGLGCLSCHSISHVPDTMGNAAMTMEYPPLHDLATSANPVIRWVHDTVTETAPKAHRRAFLKPFMRNDKSEFCATCHKVHLDVPVNNYRWLRGFNEYDAWQASGVSGHGARSFYYPEQSQECNDCHMPLVPSRDPGNIDGMVHSHRFPAANTAVPYVNGDEAQLHATTNFLKNGIVSVDIFAVAPVADEPDKLAMRRRATDAPLAATSFAVGEEAESGGAVVIREVGELAAPIDRAPAVVKPGDTVRVDTVVRTRKVGHFFPGGTVDAFDVWLELQAFDATGKPVFWSGQVEDGGAGPVEPGAHFYRSFLLDEHGNPINKRNAFHARSLLYARLIPPGAADVAHFRMRIPPDAAGPIRIVAKLNYRKFSHQYTQFSYAGQPDPAAGGEFGKNFDDRKLTYKPEDIPANVSGQIKDRIPALPIIELARAETVLPLSAGPEDSWRPIVNPDDFGRWNDYGIGLLLQGDLKGAEFAFLRVTEANPKYADGWLNVARALIQEGQTEAAKPYIAKALELGPELGRVHFFKAMIEKADGDYDAALASLRTVESYYPADRVALNQIARILFLKREYRQAIDILERVARIDPEDLQMHYTAMLCYRGIGDAAKAEVSEKLFQRFKADEASQTITGDVRRHNAEDNNERQMIHEHVSVDSSAFASYSEPRQTGGMAGGKR